MEKALTERDGAAICRTLHALKGSAGSIGADRIHRLAAELYAIGKQGDLAALADTLGSLCKEYDAFSRVAATFDAEE
jgi:HPt (histidine-containing phosphotransfer) domain-containing protein